MIYILTLENDSDRSDLITEFEGLGAKVTSYEFIPTLLTVEYDGIIYPDDRFKAVNQDSNAKLCLRNVNIDVNRSGGSWGLIRHTQRDNPFDVPGFRFPYTGSVNIARKGSGVDVYLIDSGIMGSHAEFLDRTPHTVIYDGVGTGDVDEYGHGTAMASAIRGKNIGFGEEVTLFVSRCFDAQGVSPSSSIVNGVNAAIEHASTRRPRPAIMSMSLTSSEQPVGIAAQAAADAGIVPVAACGNDKAFITTLSLGSMIYPYTSRSVLSVGGLAPDDSPYNTPSNGGTNYGPEVDILAQSEASYSAWNDGNYRVVSGTSFGTAIAAGIAACMLQGYVRPQNATEVNMFIDYVYRTAIFGKFKRHGQYPGLTDAIMYLDPRPASQVPLIPGLTKQ